MEIINKTPHPITLCKNDGSVIRIYEPDGEPVRVKGNSYWFKRDAFLMFFKRKIIRKSSNFSFVMSGVKGISGHLIRLFYDGLINPKKFVIEHHKGRYNKPIKLINEPEPKENVVYIASSKVMAFSERKDYACMFMYHGEHTDAKCPFTALILQHE